MDNQEKKTSYDPDSGLSLKDAIRHYSDPVLWFEYLTFAAPARSLRALLPRARALLKDNHPELRDIKKNRLWKKFRGGLEARLHSGELIIIGFVAPIPLDGKPDHIPKDKVRILTFDYNTSSASAPGLEIVGIRVLPSETTNQKAPLKERVKAPPDAGPQSDTETPDTLRKKQARKTKEKYARWYDLAQEIKEGGKWTRPTEIAAVIAKREKNSMERGANTANIRRRLDYHYPGWAERSQAQKK